LNAQKEEIVKPIVIASFALVHFIFGGPSVAQVQKCVGPDGKVTYSDRMCANTARASGVNTDANHADIGSRQQAQRIQSRQDDERAAALRQNPPTECKFAAYKNGDEKGKLLASNATEECLRNMDAKRTGQPTSQEAYNLWKDHHQMATAKRQGSMNRATAAAAPRGMTCRPNAMGTALDCR
jgi:hypothetical protein